jgi:hypothetical protein
MNRAETDLSVRPALREQEKNQFGTILSSVALFL